MSKMGVSVVDSYRGAYPFDALGLSQAVVDRCFPKTPAPLGGIGFAKIEHGIRQLWDAPITPDLQQKIDLPALHPHHLYTLRSYAPHHRRHAHPGLRPLRLSKTI